MSPNMFGSNPERNIQLVHRIALPVENFADSGRFFASTYRLFSDLSHSTPVGREDREATGKTVGRTSRPDEVGSRANLRNGGTEGANGDEGKGTAASVRPQLEGRDRAISANGARAEAQTRKNTGNGELDGGT
jgi:hypothetical protein